MRTTTVVITIAALAAAGTIATASEHGEHEGGGDLGDRRGRWEGEGRSRSAPAAQVDREARALYRKECGACHLDFPPGLLPSESHRRILAGLERHFGQNAELTPAVRNRMEPYLVENAAETASRGARKALGSLAGDAPLRITGLPWFQEKHRRIDTRILARPSVRSLANCAACHAGATDWDFDEDRVKIPAS